MALAATTSSRLGPITGTWRGLYASVLLPAQLEPEARRKPRDYLGHVSPPGGRILETSIRASAGKVQTERLLAMASAGKKQTARKRGQGRGHNMIPATVPADPDRRANSALKLAKSMSPSHPLRAVCPKCERGYVYSSTEVHLREPQMQDQTLALDKAYLIVTTQCAKEDCGVPTKWYTQVDLTKRVRIALDADTCLDGLHSTEAPQSYNSCRDHLNKSNAPSSIRSAHFTNPESSRRT